MRTLTQVALVAAGGALGAVARYGVGVLVVRLGVATGGLPVGTWTVNLVGSFLLGLAVPLLAGGGSAGARLVIAVGFLGSFTTFSTFSLDTLALWETGQTGWAVANAGGSVLFGLAGAVLGLWISRALV